MSGIVNHSGAQSGIIGAGMLGHGGILQILTYTDTTSRSGNQNSWQLGFSQAVTPKSASSKFNIMLRIHPHMNPNNNEGSTWSIQEGNSIITEYVTQNWFGARSNGYLSGNIGWHTISTEYSIWTDSVSLATRTFQAKWTNSESSVSGVANEHGHFEVAGNVASVLQITEYASTDLVDHS